MPLANRTLTRMRAAICYLVVHAIALIVILSARIIYAVTCPHAETAATRFGTSRPRTPVAPRVIAAVAYKEIHVGNILFTACTPASVACKVLPRCMN